jgi:predicted Zn-dependent protease
VAEGEAFLARADPRGQDIRLGLALAGLMQASGDRPRAERELRNILARRPSSAEALESLVALLGDEGRTAEADRESLAASPVQPGNQANDLRASRVLESQGDEPGSVRCLEAAETSGPVNATFELTVALKLFKLRRTGEMMGHLAVARQLSVDEGSASVTASIDKLIARMRAEAGAGAP